MKFISKIVASCLAAMALVACTPKAINDLSGEYDGVTQLQPTNVKVLETQKMGKGIKALGVEFKDATNSAIINFCSSEWILPAAEFKYSDAVKDKTFFGLVNNEVITGGNVVVNQLDKVYYISAVLHVGAKTCHVSFKGELKFIVGEDDPEPSGVTFKVTEAPIEYFDWNTFQQVTVPGMSYYSVNINDASSKEIAMLQLVGASGKKIADLVGSYTVASNATEAGTINAGYATLYEGVVYAGGTYFTDDAGVKQYITAGAITVETVKSIDDKPLYNFAGTGLDIAAEGTAVTATDASFKIVYTEEEVVEVPVASGYTFTYTVTNPVSVTTDGQTYTNYDNIDRIDIECKDASGNAAGYFSLIVAHGTPITDIAGSYPIASGNTEAGKCEAGVCFPAWNVMMYTYVMDGGIAKYASEGTVVVKVAKDATGKDLFNFKYSGVKAVWSPNGTYGSDWTDIAESTDLAGEIVWAAAAN